MRRADCAELFLFSNVISRRGGGNQMSRDVLLRA